METVQQVNAIGHLALTLLLLAQSESLSGRVVASSSVMSKTGGSLDVNDISYMCGKYCGVQAYARSKLLINLLTAKLAQLYANDGVRFFAGDPGITHTPIGNAFISYFFRRKLSRYIWPSNSPDMNPMNFATLSILENKRSRTFYNNLDSLKTLYISIRTFGAPCN
uniref:Short-chain dehydrogenase/reductase SDR n=1 Tax=Heterorhabditis bacteriophora TaxID=37862 RepID=A0A1I7WI62_HETBA